MVYDLIICIFYHITFKIEFSTENYVHVHTVEPPETLDEI